MLGIIVCMHRLVQFVIGLAPAPLVAVAQQDANDMSPASRPPWYNQEECISLME